MKSGRKVKVRSDCVRHYSRSWPTLHEVAWLAGLASAPFPSSRQTPIARLRPETARPIAQFDCLLAPKHVPYSLVFHDNPIAAGEINTTMADMISSDMRSYASRIATFQQPHQLSKRRASSQGKKKNQQTTEWPHKHPSPEEVCL